ncbi:MAG TPA: acyltransferase [Anaerolineales bacterium]|nr:acyltransferase [Anaerolineales bacterium]
MKTNTISSTLQAPGMTAEAVAGVQPRAATRLLFVDNIRVFLTVLVILHHLIIIYAGSGGWFWKEGRQDVVTEALGAWFTAVNHTYFMGLFLLVAAYFVPGSYDRKGAAQFLKDRLVRLGIPLIVYSWLLRPLWIYAYLVIYQALRLPLLTWYFQGYFRDYGWIGGGPLWFIEALLIFSALYALWRLLVPTRQEAPVRENRFPSHGAIALFALLVALASFVVRFWFPSDTVFKPLNFQLADFSQYIALFIVGLVAYRRNWFQLMPESVGRRWLAVAVFLILIFPPVAILGGATENDQPFKGGWHWQAMLGALWQSYLCVSMCISLIYLFRRRFDHQGRLAASLSRNAYTAYLVHEPVITYLALMAVNITLYPLLKFTLMALVATPLCFGLSSLIRRLPYAERVL